MQENSWVANFSCQLKEVFFIGGQKNHFSEKWFQLFLLVVWPRELMHSTAYCLENIFIIYHVVIRPLENFYGRTKFGWRYAAFSKESLLNYSQH